MMKNNPKKKVEIIRIHPKRLLLKIDALFSYYFTLGWIGSRSKILFCFPWFCPYIFCIQFLYHAIFFLYNFSGWSHLSVSIKRKVFCLLYWYIFVYDVGLMKFNFHSTSISIIKQTYQNGHYSTVHGKMAITLQLMATVRYFSSLLKKLIFLFTLEFPFFKCIFDCDSTYWYFDVFMCFCFP